jgi:Tfp pilus assembly protein PilO
VATKTEQNKLSGNNLMIVLLLVSLLAVGAAGLISKSLISSIVINTKVVNAKNKAESNVKSDLTAAPQLVSAYSALGSEATTLSDSLPTTVDFPSLLVEIENMSTGAGLVVKQISPAVSNAVPTSTTSSAQASTPQSVSYTMNYDGTYQAVQTMLTDLQTSARPVRVTGLTVSGSGSSISGEIDFETFYQPQSALPFSTETIK